MPVHWGKTARSNAGATMSMTRPPLQPVPGPRSAPAHGTPAWWGTGQTPTAGAQIRPTRVKTGRGATRSWSRATTTTVESGTMATFSVGASAMVRRHRPTAYTATPASWLRAAGIPVDFWTMTLSCAGVATTLGNPPPLLIPVRAPDVPSFHPGRRSPAYRWATQDPCQYTNFLGRPGSRMLLGGPEPTEAPCDPSF